MHEAMHKLLVTGLVTEKFSTTAKTAYTYVSTANKQLTPECKATAGVQGRFACHWASRPAWGNNMTFLLAIQPSHQGAPVVCRYLHSAQGTTL
jgi:hypothetical protein